jgi:hypothetical protein
MLRRILLYGTTSSVLTDCTVNVASDGSYPLQLDKSLSSQIILLIEQSFQNEINALKQTAETIRLKLNQTPNYFADNTLEKFRKEFSLYIRILLANHKHIKEIDIRILPYDNGGSDLIKYTRSNNPVSNGIDYEAINDDITKQDIILQSFTVSNAREIMNRDSQHILSTKGWWFGPVLCEKNKDETFIMANILVLTNG